MANAHPAMALASIIMVIGWVEAHLIIAKSF
jgi:hypothetical protein